MSLELQPVSCLTTTVLLPALQPVIWFVGFSWELGIWPCPQTYVETALPASQLIFDLFKTAGKALTAGAA